MRLIVFSLATTIVLAGCGGASDVPSPSTAPANDTVSNAAHSVSPNNPVTPASNAALQHQAAMQRADEQRRRQEALKQLQRSFINVDFEEIDAEGRVVVRLVNATGKDIDDVRGGIHAEDTEGNFLAASGLTIAVPGDVFLVAGGSNTHRPFMSVREELNEKLRAQPDDVRFWFEANEVTYTDGSSEAGLDD